jgi:hypothetical protein
MSWIDFLGYAASAAVLGTFCMSSMLHLRLLAIASNILFICFGALGHILPVLTLHLALLPVNLTHLVRVRRRIGVYRVRNRTRSGLRAWRRAESWVRTRSWPRRLNFAEDKP